MAESYREMTRETRSPASSARAVDRGYDDERGIGWVVFAGTMLAIAGVLNTIYGIAAISDSSFYVGDVRFILGDLNTYGWLVLVVGVVQLCAAVGIWAYAQWARWVGVLSAGVNAVVQLVWISAAPWLAVGLFAIDVLVIYGLISYGGRRPLP